MNQNDDILPVLYWFPAPYQEGPGRQAQLTAELSAHRRVVYLAERGVGPGLRSGLEVSDGLAQVTVLTLRIGRQLARLTRRAPLLAGLIRGHMVRRGLRSLGIGRYIIVFAGPTRWLLVPLCAQAVVLDLQDPPFGESVSYRENLQRIAGQACLVTATAASLEEEAAEVGANVVRLRNAVSESLVESWITGSRNRLGRTRVGYLGTVDSRVDIDLLAEIARLAPEIEVLVAGRVNPDQTARLDWAADRNENLKVLGGPLSQTDSEAFLAGLDVGLVPFIENDTSDALNATKYYHYAAHGLPIVATDTREARDLAPNVIVASGAVATVATIKNVVETAGISEAQIAFAAANTWSLRAAQLHELLSTYCDSGCAGRRSTLRSRWLT